MMLSKAISGLDTVNLRNLGVNRTLVLFDGQRVVSSNIFGGGVDLSTIPTSLVQRVDVVTGGASATYGSDAVAGVVNLIINKNFTGLKGDFQAGDTTTFEHRQAKAELSWGTDFAGGKGSSDPKRQLCHESGFRLFRSGALQSGRSDRP